MGHHPRGHHSIIVFFFLHRCCSGLERSWGATVDNLYPLMNKSGRSWQWKIQLQMDLMGFLWVFLWIDGFPKGFLPGLNPWMSHGDPGWILMPSPRQDPRVQQSLWSTVRFAGVSDAVLQKARTVCDNTVGSTWGSHLSERASKDSWHV